jgi:hypothetical protein
MGSLEVVMDDREREIRLKLKNDFKHYASKCLKIRTKEGNIEPLIFNKAQQYLDQLVDQQRERTGRVRIIVVKGRQQGCSTYISGRGYHITSHRKGVRAFILTHFEDATKNLFEMALRYHEHCPDLVKPQTKASNAKELIFGVLDSGYRLGTAGNKSVGRSSTIQFFHGSEVAFWPNAQEHAKGILQAIPDAPDTEVYLESTANGLGNYFHQQWQLAETGQSEFLPVFIPWYWQDEYKKPVPADGFTPTEKEIELQNIYDLTLGQLIWRRAKIVDLSVSGIDGEKAFMQEYPCSATEAFQTTGEDCFIPPELVMRARKGFANENGALVVGVDPARFGDDRTSIIRRRGRVAFKLQSYSKKDTMEVVGLIVMIIKEEKPVKVFIDVGGLGAGIVDRLREMGYSDIIVAVNSGSVPLNADRYVNKRAEMWGVMKEWMLDEPCQIPDIDSLHADLCSPSYKFDSITRLVLEKVEDIKKRGLRSPDEATALALTFAYPFSATKERKIEYSNKGIV